MIGMTVINFEEHDLMATNLIRNIRRNICGPCEDERKEDQVIDYENPLFCSCNCLRVEAALSPLLQIVAP